MGEMSPPPHQQHEAHVFSVVQGRSLEKTSQLQYILGVSLHFLLFTTHVMVLVVNFVQDAGMLPR